MGDSILIARRIDIDSACGFQRAAGAVRVLPIGSWRELEWVRWVLPLSRTNAAATKEFR